MKEQDSGPSSHWFEETPEEIHWLVSELCSLTELQPMRAKWDHSHIHLSKPLVSQVKIHYSWNPFKIKVVALLEASISFAFRLQ